MDFVILFYHNIISEREIRYFESIINIAETYQNVTQIKHPINLDITTKTFKSSCFHIYFRWLFII
jgi:hypothetical protein